MTLLRVYVSAAYASCAIAYQRVAQVRRRLHHLVEVIDLDQAGVERPSAVFGTPTYCLDDQVISLGNPSLPALLAELDRAIAPPGDIPRVGGDTSPGGNEMPDLWCLAEVDIFQDLSPSEMDAIAARAPRQTVEAGTVFYSPEQRTEVLFILKQGRVRVFRLSPAGKALTTAIITPGTIFGEMMILGQRMHDNYAEALEACVICLMSREDVQQMLLSDPRIAARIAETLGNRLAEMEQRLSDVVFKAMPQRIASALLALGRAEQGRRRWPFGPAVWEVRLTHEQLAELVGTSRETTTKVLGELRDQGLIELRRGTVALLDLKALEAFAEATPDS